MNSPTLRVRARKNISSAAVPGNGVSPRPPKRRARTADSPAARSRQVLQAMVAFRDGDFSVRLPLEWEDMDGRIAGAFNQAIAQKERIAKEVTRLSITVGTEGRLKQRMTLPGAIGDWATATMLTSGMPWRSR